MTENTIRALLDDVVRTGRVPDYVTVRAAITKYSSVAERREIEKRVRIAAAKIVNALDSNLPDAAAEHAADIGESLSVHTAAGGPSPRDLAAEVPRADSVAAMSRVPGRSRIAAEPLRELLRGATQRGLRAAELDTLSTRPGLTGEERTRWRAEVVAAANEVQRVFASGNQGKARALADEHAGRLGAELIEPEHTDPHADITDPRQLAALLPRDRARG